jgi:hypothetical protein
MNPTPDQLSPEEIAEKRYPMSNPGYYSARYSRKGFADAIRERELLLRIELLNAERELTRIKEALRKLPDPSQ